MNTLESFRLIARPPEVISNWTDCLDIAARIARQPSDSRGVTVTNTQTYVFTPMTSPYTNRGRFSTQARRTSHRGASKSRYD
ncbi:unnamed protein product [Leptosia nina]|uniref:Uncharacterized protein n=1 Tax=Leptosia nina TaxID=320188 RepID=A0AAV1J1Z3_9NEOP